MAESKQARRQQLATALTSWWLNMQRNAFYLWLDNTRDAVMTREVCIAGLPLPTCLKPTSVSMQVTAN